jgi:hypothetical protein
MSSAESSTSEPSVTVKTTNPDDGAVRAVGVAAARPSALITTAGAAGTTSGLDVVGPASEGMTAVGKYSTDTRAQNPNALWLHWGFIDGSRRFVTTPSYPFDAVQSFSEGFAGVAIDVPDRVSRYVFNRKWGFIKRGGQPIGAGLSYPYDAVRRFSSGMAAVMTKRYNLPSPYAYTESWCFVTAQGTPINALTCLTGFSEVRDFQGSTALVRTSAGSSTIDKNWSGILRSVVPLVCWKSRTRRHSGASDASSVTLPKR